MVTIAKPYSWPDRGSVGWKSAQDEIHMKVTGPLPPCLNPGTAIRYRDSGGDISMSIAGIINVPW